MPMPPAGWAWTVIGRGPALANGLHGAIYASRTGSHLSVPACTFPTPSCRAAVKDGRHASGAVCGNASRPLLDRREQDGMLMCSGLESHRRKVTLECDR